MGQWSEITPKEHEILRRDIGLAPAASGLSLEQPDRQPGKPAADRKSAKFKRARKPRKR